MLDPKFWKNKKVLITGHTGFKGSWLSTWLLHLGAKVHGYALPPLTDPSMYRLTKLSDRIEKSAYADIRNRATLLDRIERVEPAIIFHLAAQPLVRYSYLHPVETFTANVVGTLNVLDVARSVSAVKVIEVITTDKCYKITKDTGYAEDDPLGGKDPYSASKACAELITECYRDSFFSSRQPKTILTVRAGNVIGGGDWAEDRLVPNAILALNSNNKLKLRNPDAIRPWQHVLDVLYGYLYLVELSFKNKELAGAWNFGPNETEITVADFMNKFFELYGSGGWVKENEKSSLTETKILKLNCEKANKNLDWQPRLKLEDAIRWTVDWYKKAAAKEDMFAFTIQQILDYNM